MEVESQSASQPKSNRMLSAHRRLRFTFLDTGKVGDSSGVNQSPHCLRASTSDSFSAAFLTSVGTHCGNATVTTLCAPDFVCSSRTASRRAGPISSARRTSAGHKRRWMYVILPPSSRQTSTSAESRTARVARKIARPLGCPHQVPRIASPAMASASDRTGPRPLSKTTPCSSTKASAPSDDEKSWRMSPFYYRRGSGCSISNSSAPGPWTYADRTPHGRSLGFFESDSSPGPHGQKILVAVLAIEPHRRRRISCRGVQNYRELPSSSLIFHAIQRDTRGLRHRRVS